MVPVLWTISAVTMIVGNLVAIAQTNIKRLLAYSSISHAGYIFMAMVPYWQPKVAGDAVSAALFYLVAYAFTNLGAWAVVIALEQNEGRGLEIQDFAGLASKYPALAAAMAIFMLSFTGVPPTLGFLGKFYLFRAVLEGGYVSLAIIGVLTSLVSAYYYLRVVIVMYMQEGAPLARREPWLYITTLVAAAGTVLFTFFSAPFLAWASQAILQIF
jgi:NADH-quinone oxidoreductase subunit N